MGGGAVGKLTNQRTVYLFNCLLIGQEYFLTPPTMQTRSSCVFGLGLGNFGEFERIGDMSFGIDPGVIES